MDSTDQYSLILCVYYIDVVEIIHGQYLKGFLLSQRRRNVGKVLGNPSLVHVLRKLYKGSCSKRMGS